MYNIIALLIKYIELHLGMSRYIYIVYRVSDIDHNSFTVLTVTLLWLSHCLSMHACSCMQCTMCGIISLLSMTMQCLFSQLHASSPYSIGTEVIMKAGHRLVIMLMTVELALLLGLSQANPAQVKPFTCLNLKTNTCMHACVIILLHDINVCVTHRTTLILPGHAVVYYTLHGVVNENGLMYNIIQGKMGV